MSYPESFFERHNGSDPATESFFFITSNKRESITTTSTFTTMNNYSINLLSSLNYIGAGMMDFCKSNILYPELKSKSKRPKYVISYSIEPLPN